MALRVGFLRVSPVRPHAVVTDRSEPRIKKPPRFVNVLACGVRRFIPAAGYTRRPVSSLGRLLIQP